jgi:hypothetical protein
MFTRTTVILERKVWYQHAHLCVSKSHCVWKLHSAWINHTLRVKTTICVNKSHSCVLKSHFTFGNYSRACVYHSMRVNITQEWFIHPECDVDTYECDYDTHENDYDTHESDYDTYTCQKPTLRVEITLLCDVHTHSVMNTRTSVISERKVWF